MFGARAGHRPDSPGDLQKFQRSGKFCPPTASRTGKSGTVRIVIQQIGKGVDREADSSSLCNRRGRDAPHGTTLGQHRRFCSPIISYSIHATCTLPALNKSRAAVQFHQTSSLSLILRSRPSPGTAPSHDVAWICLHLPPFSRVRNKRWRLFGT